MTGVALLAFPLGDRQSAWKFCAKCDSRRRNKVHSLLLANPDDGGWALAGQQRTLRLSHALWDPSKFRF